MQTKEAKKQKEEALSAESGVNAGCPCFETSCARHGRCKLCQAYHKEHPECGKTACGK